MTKLEGIFTPEEQKQSDKDYNELINDVGNYSPWSGLFPDSVDLDAEPTQKRETRCRKSVSAINTETDIKQKKHLLRLQKIGAVAVVTLLAVTAGYATKRLVDGTIDKYTPSEEGCSIKLQPNETISDIAQSADLEESMNKTIYDIENTRGNEKLEGNEGNLQIGTIIYLEDKLCESKGIGKRPDLNANQ